MTRQELVELITTMAWSANLPPVLVLAVVEQESNFDPWAMRYEAGFFRRYIQPLVLKGEIKTDTEAHGRAMSWGLLQIMGQVARESGFKGKYLSELCDPSIGLYFGCRHLSSKIVQAGGDTHRALLYWNGGGNKSYPDEVIEKMARWKTQLENGGKNA